MAKVQAGCYGYHRETHEEAFLRAGRLPARLPASAPPVHTRQGSPEVGRAQGLAGAPGQSGVPSRYEGAAAEYDATVATARKRQAGQYDALDAPTIAYLAETYHGHRSGKAEEARWHPKNLGGAWGQAQWGAEERERWNRLHRAALVETCSANAGLRAAGDPQALSEAWRGQALAFAAEARAPPPRDLPKYGRNAARPRDRCRTAQPRQRSDFAPASVRRAPSSSQLGQARRRSLDRPWPARPQSRGATPRRCEGSFRLEALRRASAGRCATPATSRRSLATANARRPTPHCNRRERNHHGCFLPGRQGAAARSAEGRSCWFCLRFHGRQSAIPPHQRA